jgi:hypothetical protein
MAGRSTEALVALLRPWHAALRRLGSPRIPTNHFESPRRETPPYVLWIADEYLVASARLPGANIPRVRMLEAVALLRLLARVDVRAWADTVLGIWPEEEVREWIEDHMLMATESSPPSFTVAISITVLKGKKRVRQLERLCKSTERDVVSHKFSAAYSFLENYFGPMAVSLRSTSWHIPLHIDFDLLDTDPHKVSPLLADVLKCALQCRVDAAPEVSLNRAIVQIEELEIVDIDGVVFDEDALKIWKEFTDLGVRVNRFPDLAVAPYKESWECVVDMARSLMNVPGSVAVDGLATPGVEALMLSTKNSPRYLPGLAAAAQVSPSLRTVELEIVADDDDFFYDEDEEHHQAQMEALGMHWRWIAYGIFSRHAEHAVTTLRMDLSDLRSEHVEIMEAIVLAPDPLARFYDVHEKREPMRTLRGSRFHMMDPDTESHTYAYEQGTRKLVHVTKHQAVFTTKTPITMRVIYPTQNADDPYYTVMIPGQGDGWVHKDEITDLTETALPESTEDWRSTVRSFPYVDILVMNDESMAPTVKLLTLVGRDTTFINLSTFEGSEDVDEWVRDVLRVCPRLEDLIVGMAPVRSLQLFVEAAETGTCHLRRLVIGDAYCNGYEPFFRALSDHKHHPLGTHLESLDVYFVVENKADVEPIMAAVCAMLETNRRLHSIRVGFRLGSTFASLEPTIQKGFANATQDKIPIRAAPLAMRSKLAFLSSVRHHSHGQQAVGQLDSCVAMNIFQFAAHARTRRFSNSNVTMFS